MTSGPTLNHILVAVLRSSGAAREDVFRKVHRQPVPARQRFVLLARRLRPDISLTVLGRFLERDASGVRDLQRSAERRLQREPGELAMVHAALAVLGLDDLPPYDRHAARRRTLEREIRFAEAKLERLRAREAALEPRP